MDEIEKIIESKLKEDYNKFFMNGLIGGWNAAWSTVYELCKDKTSAKAIKEAIKAKYEESNRILKENNDAE